MEAANCPFLSLSDTGARLRHRTRPYMQRQTRIKEGMRSPRDVQPHSVCWQSVALQPWVMML